MSWLCGLWSSNQNCHLHKFQTNTWQVTAFVYRDGGRTWFISYHQQYNCSRHCPHTQHHSHFHTRIQTSMSVLKQLILSSLIQETHELVSLKSRLMACITAYEIAIIQFPREYTPSEPLDQIVQSVKTAQRFYEQQEIVVKGLTALLNMVEADWSAAKNTNSPILIR